MITSTNAPSSKPTVSDVKSIKPKAAANHRGPQGPRMNEDIQDRRLDAVRMDF